MSISYEKIVNEDLNIGYGTVDVTMPAGGVATGNKIGLHTFSGYYDPKHFGAVGDAIHDDTSAIQTAIDAAVADGRGILLSPGYYRTTAALLFYNRATPVYVEGLRMVGCGGATSHIVYEGPSNTAPIRMIGGFHELACFAIVNNNGVGWLGGIEYDGDAAIGRSTHGTLRQVWIDGDNGTGDGIALGRQGYQADMLKIDHCYINKLPYGSGIVTYNANVLSIVVIAPTIAYCRIGAYVGQTTNLSILGGEIDHCDLNVLHAGGTGLILDGIRSEHSKRFYFSSVGSYAQPLTMRTCGIHALNNVRAATTGNINAASATLTLSTTAFTYGDRILVAGAGAGGIDLQTRISGIDATGYIATITPVAGTTVTGAAVTLDGTVIQQTLVEQGGGPYIHIGNLFNDTAGCAATVANGPQSWLGNYWAQDMYDPYGTVTGGTIYGSITILSNTSNALARTMNSRIAVSPATQFTANLVNPSVLTGSIFYTANTVATAYTDFIDGYNGQVLHVLVYDAYTSFTGGGNIRTPGGVTVTGISGSVYTFTKMFGVWFIGALA